MWGNPGQGLAGSSSEAGRDIDIWEREKRAAWFRSRKQREKCHTMKWEKWEDLSASLGWLEFRPKVMQRHRMI